MAAALAAAPAAGRCGSSFRRSRWSGRPASRDPPRPPRCPAGRRERRGALTSETAGPQLAPWRLRLPRQADDRPDRRVELPLSRVLRDPRPHGPGRQAHERRLRFPEHVAEVRGGPEARRRRRCFDRTRRRSARRWTRPTRPSARRCRTTSSRRSRTPTSLPPPRPRRRRGAGLRGRRPHRLDRRRAQRGGSRRDRLGRQGPLPAREGPATSRWHPVKEPARREGRRGVLRRAPSQVIDVLALMGDSPTTSRASGASARRPPKSSSELSARSTRLRAPRRGEGEEEGAPRGGSRGRVPLANARRAQRPTAPGAAREAPRALPHPPL